MVIAKYGEPYRHSFGKSEEKFRAKTLEGLVKKIEKKYEGKEYVNTIRDYSLIRYNNEFVRRIKKDDKYFYSPDVKLKKDDEVLFMMLMGGG